MYKIYKIFSRTYRYLPSYGQAFARRISRNRYRGSANYWETRYSERGNSGPGSFGKFASFKADVLNDFVAANQIKSVIEFGCGDGNQLALAAYPSYIGMDVSETAIALCREKFRGDKHKRFVVYELGKFESACDMPKADLALSLDVIYHLTEDEVYEDHLRNLFAVARRYVIIYSTNGESQNTAAHVRHREFLRDVKKRYPQWPIFEVFRNPFQEELSGSDGFVADFYIFKLGLSYTLSSKQR